MRSVRLAAMVAAAAFALGGTAAAAHWPTGGLAAPVISGPSTCPGMYGDYSTYDPQSGYGRRPWRCDVGTRNHRDALEDGFFGHGRVAGRGFDYDRGYPYDYYPADAGEEYDEPAYAAAEAEPVTRPLRCETIIARDARGRKTVPVRICRN